MLALVPAEELSSSPYPRSVSIDARSWAAVAQELRDRFPDLARRVLTESDTVAGGFVLVLNDEVMPRRTPAVELADDDEICVIAAIAGG